MLPKSYLALLTPPRIAEALRRIEAQIWVNVPGSCCVTQTEPTLEFRTFDQIKSDNVSFTPVPSDRFHWGPKYAQRWFHVTLPSLEKEHSSAPLYFVWEDQGEATVYIDGVPYYGLDIAHRYCPLPANTQSFHIESACVRTGIWLDGTSPALSEEGSEYRPPRLMRRNDTAWNVFHDLRVLLDVIECDIRETQPTTHPSPKALTDPVRYTTPLLRVSPFIRRWLNQIEDALDILDHDGLASFATALRKIYADSPADASSRFRATLTGHAHIDLVWLWQERVGEFKSVHTWANATRMLERYPEMRFGFSQPHAYHAVARRAPALHDHVKKLISTRQWDAVGAAYVESDTHLPCGEALLRSLQLGQEDFIKLRGTPSTVFWLPDVFGYNACVPQLLRGMGVTGFFTSKLSWSTVTKFPHTSFRWRGLDGSEIASHISLHHDYNECVGIRNLREDALGHQQSGIHPESLIPTGYGDGGGGPTEAMCERARRVANLTGVPQTAWGNIEDFFARLNSVEKDLPVMAGELAVEIHRGIFTTHVRLKQAFRGLERALQQQEAVHIAQKLGPIPVEPWHRLIFAQFHDYIPGSCIWEVYAEAIPELETLAKEALAISTKTLAGSSNDGKTSLESGTALATNGGGTTTLVAPPEKKQATASEPLAVFNPLPIARTHLCADGSLLEVGPLQGALLSAAQNAPTVTAAGLTLHSNRVTAEFTEQGHLRSLTIDGKPLRLKNEGHALHAYADYPCVSPAWDLDRPSLVKGVPATLTPNTKPTLATAPGLAAITFHVTLANGNTAHTRYELRAGEPVLRVRYNIDLHTPHTLIKAVISTNYTANHARFACPFGSVLRSQWPSYPREEAQWEVPASRWMVLADDTQSEGLSIITKASYGFTVRDGIVGASLVRSAWVTEAELHPKVRATPNRPDYSDIGHHEIEIALGRYAPDLPAAEHPANLADTLYTPCLPCADATIDAGLSALTMTPSVAPSWAKPIDTGTWVLRLQETDGRHANAKLSLVDGWRAATTTFLEQTPAAENWKQDQLTVILTPYQVISVMITNK